MSAIVSRTVADLSHAVRRITVEEVQRLVGARVTAGPLVSASVASAAASAALPWSGPPHRPGQDRLRAAVESYEKELLVRALDANGWNFNETARFLGMPHTTVKYKCRKYGLSSPRGGRRRGGRRKRA
ncbi:MAG TPA: helix-turn-helix domain-containing protein [Polyangia bacterium]|nr:helix-turn-helix domain-containing protein [Polyangia bacterium]